MPKVSDNGARIDIDGSEGIYLFTPGVDWQSDLNNIITDLRIAVKGSDGKLSLADIPDGLVGGGGGGTGDVLGPSSSTDSRPALFSGTSGKALKQGEAGQLVPSGGTAGQVLVKIDATNYNLGWVNQSVGVTGPSVAVDGQPVVFNGATGGLVKAGVAGQFVPTGGSVGQALVKTGAGNYAVGWAAVAGGVSSVNGLTGAPVLTPAIIGAATAAQGALADTAAQAADLAAVQATASAAVVNTVTAVRTAVVASGADPTQGPLLGAGNHVARLSQSKTDLIAQWNALLAKEEMVAVVLPYVGGVFPPITPGGLLTMGSALASNIYGVGQATTTGISVDPDSWPYAGPDELFVSKTPAEAWKINDDASPYAARIVTLAANVLSFNAGDGRAVITSTPTGSVTFSSACWNGILEGASKVRVAIPMGATAQTIAAAVGPDGLYPIGMTAPPATYAANTTHFFDLWRFNGRPVIEALGGGAVTAPEPVYMGKTFAAATSVTPPAHQTGDIIMADAFSAGGTQPTLPAGWTDCLVGGDANLPQLRRCYKVAASNAETVTGFTSASQIHCHVLRKAGGTPTLGPVSYFKTTNIGDGTMTWQALTLAQSAIVIAFHGLNTTDTGVMRSLINSGASGSQTNGSPTYVGASDLQPAGTFPATTTAKTGTVARAITSQVAWY